MLAPFAGPGEYPHHGERVVKGQLLTQAASDPFLGWTTGAGIDGRAGQGLLRPPAARHEGQHERPADGPAPARLLRQALRLGAGPRARPHRAGHHDLRLHGRQRGFDHAIADFAVAYADQNEQDYRRLSRRSPPDACWRRSTSDSARWQITTQPRGCPCDRARVTPPAADQGSRQCLLAGCRVADPAGAARAHANRAGLVWQFLILTAAARSRGGRMRLLPANISEFRSITDQTLPVDGLVV